MSGGLGLALGVVITLIFALVGVIAAAKQINGRKAALAQRRVRIQSERSGWVYFLSPVDGEWDDPPAPIKIGMTHRDPLRYRLPEIETMSPTPLKLLWSFPTSNPALSESQIHRVLAPHRRHGEWFDRDATLMYIDHLKGEV